MTTKYKFYRFTEYSVLALYLCIASFPAFFIAEWIIVSLYLAIILFCYTYCNRNKVLLRKSLSAINRRNAIILISHYSQVMFVALIFSPGGDKFFISMIVLGVGLILSILFQLPQLMKIELVKHSANT